MEEAAWKSIAPCLEEGQSTVGTRLSVSAPPWRWRRGTPKCLAPGPVGGSSPGLFQYRRFDTVFPAAGSGSSAIELTCGELEEYSHALGWIDVCKGWQEAE